MSKGLLAGAAAVAVLAAGSAQAASTELRRSSADMRGLTFLVGGGVEGYTNGLRDQIDPGLAYGVTVAIKPTNVLGIELGYTGAISDFNDGRLLTTDTSGPDIVRNGAQAAVTLGLSATPLQPYVMGGVGLSRYNVRALAPGFQDDTVGNIPVGAGLRLHIGSFTADARVNYNFLFDQEFALTVPPSDVNLGSDETFSSGGRYVGTINLGATF
ncbi:outer membrane beta-barrel protein [Corallococcus interemptor]|uniref:outer membrane beta-barrel protein n=1 Tax=Corallococcus interemptor TaxID=2316720 RepID=UPI003CFBE128